MKRNKPMADGERDWKILIQYLEIDGGNAQWLLEKNNTRTCIHTYQYL
jgi:hypothetical protein